MSIGRFMFLAKSSGLSFLNSSHSVASMQQSAFLRQLIADVAYWILCLKMDCAMASSLGMPSCFALHSKMETGGILKVKVKAMGSHGGCQSFAKMKRDGCIRFRSRFLACCRTKDTRKKALMVTSQRALKDIED
jgi:hypothetical protein